MSNTTLPSVNFDAAPGYSEFKFLHEIYSSEFFLRSFIAADPGIVDKEADPTSAADTSRPLFVSLNAANPLTLDITKGYAVTPSHKLIVVDEDLSSVPLPDVIADRQYVVAVEYKLIASKETRLARFLVPAAVRLERPSLEPFGENESSTLAQVVTVVSMTDYLNTSLFPASRKEDLIVIAVATARADAITGQLSLILDLTRTTFDFNRPWFSTLDPAHRAKIGSGAVNDRNPHGTLLQDLISAGFSLYQQLLPRGGVFSKDLALYGYPGVFCQELVSINRFQIDDKGRTTSDPALGLEELGGRYFVTLTKVPTRVGSLYFQGRPWEPVPYSWKPGTRYLVLGSLEQPFEYGESLILEYFAVSALMPPFEPLNLGVQSFEVGQPTANQDYVVSGGQTISTLTAPVINLPASAGPIKKAYTVVCNVDGTLVLSPQNLVPVLRVSDILAQTTVSINQAPINGGACRLTLGLTNAQESLTTAVGFDLNLKLRLSGLNENNGAVEEDVTFKASQWREQSATELREEPLQFRTTKNKFTLLTSVKILNTTTDPDNSGDNAIISIWANILEARENQELANVASLFWDGSGARRVTDQRLVASTVQRADQRAHRFPLALPEGDAAFIQEFFSVILDPPLTDPTRHSRRLGLELDDDRYLAETWDTFSTSSASGSLIVTSFTNITQGMTLRISENKVLSFVTSSADTSLGEVLIPTSLATGDVEIRNNIVATVNDPDFDSTWFAEAGTNNVIFTRPESYPEGFAVCERRKLVFSQDFTLGTLDFRVNGEDIATVTSTGNHATSLLALEEAVNDLSATTGVTAIQVIASPRNYLMLNGPVTGQNFAVTDIVTTMSGLTVVATEPPDAFILTQPEGGALPTPHLPDRFASREKVWHYLSRAMEWPGVTLRAEIALTGDTATNIQNQDQIQIAPGKILIARRAALPPSTNKAIGEFLVTPTSLADTLKSMRDTVNDDNFDSGVRASVDDTETKLILEVSGYAAADVELLLETTPGTWLITQYEPVGPALLPNERAVGFIKTLSPLMRADWRYQLVNPQASIGTFTDAEVSEPNNNITIANHGLSNGQSVFIRAASGSIMPFGLLAEQNYYVVLADTNTFALALSVNGAPVELESSGSGSFTLLVNEPFGPGQWSPWQPMEFVSPTAYRFRAPPASALYAIQLRLDGEPGKPNGFSLYQLSPTVSGATLAQLDTRLTTAEADLDALELEVQLARGSTGSLGTRLAPALDSAGELIGAAESVIHAATTTLVERLDRDESLTYWLTGSVSNALTPTKMGHLGLQNQLLRGPSDTLGNSTLFNQAGNVLQINASSASPLYAAVGGNGFRYARQHSLDFTGVTPTGIYYIFIEIAAGEEMGKVVVSGTTTSTSLQGSSTVTAAETFTPLVTDILTTQGNPLVIVYPGFAYGALSSFYVPIASALTANSLQLVGQLPLTIPLGTAYEVRSPREMGFTFSQTRTESVSKLCIGQVNWTGAGFTDLRPYQYLGQYKSPISSQVDVTSTTFETRTFDHNLGRIPRNFSLLAHVISTGDSEPHIVNADFICKATETTMTVKNRYSNVMYKNFTGNVTVGYLQLIV